MTTLFIEITCWLKNILQKITQIERDSRIYSDSLSVNKIAHLKAKQEPIFRILKVFSPWPLPKKKLPVMVYIHGGMVEIVSFDS